MVLLGRTALPARETWAEVLADENGSAAIKQRIEAVQAMEAAGAAVLPLSADVADAGQMTAAFETAAARFGRIDGVFHGAGLLDKRAFTLVAETTAEGNDAHFRICFAQSHERLREGLSRLTNFIDQRYG